METGKGVGVMDRANILATASALICVDREYTHGDPHQFFALVAKDWSNKVGVEITPSQAALMMESFKICRAWLNPAREDNYVDAAGYSAIAAELAKP